MMPSAFDIYRKTLTSLEETDSAWWYLGTTTLSLPDRPEIIVNHVETVMIYRSVTLSPDSYRVPWWEIGVFRDAITGEVPTAWLNPVTGKSMAAARVFEEGPSGYSMRAKGNDGVEIFDAVQAFAKLDSADVRFQDDGDRVIITQEERKTRSFPGLNGIPDLDKGEGSKAHTILQFSAARSDLESNSASVPATGMYSLEIDAPAWLGMEGRPCKFMIKGLMHKAPMNFPLNPRGWSDLAKLFPQYFDGEIIKPRWE